MKAALDVGHLVRREADRVGSRSEQPPQRAIDIEGVRRGTLPGLLCLRKALDSGSEPGGRVGLIGHSHYFL